MSARQRVCVVGGGISGLAAAWALGQHPDRFDVELYERNDDLGGNAVTVDIPQGDGTLVPIDVSVTAYIPTVYQNYARLLERFGIASLPTRFSYTVSYGPDVYAHDFDSDLKRELQPEIDRFQRLLRRIQRVNALNKRRSRLAAAVNPFNYVPMGRILDAQGFSSAFRFKILKPMFVNFLLAGNVFDLPAGMFAMYLDFFDIERSTAMVTWDQGTRNLYRHMAADLAGKIHRGRGVARVRRTPQAVFVRDEAGGEERFDQHQGLVGHNQQPWARRSDRPCLVTYNPVQPIDPAKIVRRLWFQHVIHGVLHSTALLGLFPRLQGRERTWYCGAHTLVNSQEHCLISGLAVARQLGADYPFADGEARRWFNFYGRMLMGRAFRKADGAG